MTLAELLEKAWELDPADRVRLARELLDSVESTGDNAPAVEAEWQSELRRRIDDIESGRVQLVDGRETIRVARARIADRRAQQSA